MDLHLKIGELDEEKKLRYRMLKWQIEIYYGRVESAQGIQYSVVGKKFQKKYMVNVGRYWFRKKEG